jgi:hypothetical protein
MEYVKGMELVQGMEALLDNNVEPWALLSRLHRPLRFLPLALASVNQLSHL